LGDRSGAVAFFSAGRGGGGEGEVTEGVGYFFFPTNHGGERVSSATSATSSSSGCHVVHAVAVFFPACSGDQGSGYGSWFQQATVAVSSLELHYGDYWRHCYVTASDSTAVGLPLGRCSALGVGSSCALPQVVCPRWRCCRPTSELRSGGRRGPRA
jgi:hypothetical protein